MDDSLKVVAKSREEANEILKKYHDNVISLICHATKIRKYDIDFIRDCYVHLLEKSLTNYDCVHKLSTFICCYAELYQKNNWKKKVKEYHNIRTTPIENKFEPDPLDELVKNDLLLKIRKLVDQQPARIQEILKMRYKDHLMAKDIANRLNLNRQMVENAVYGFESMVRAKFKSQ